MAAPFWPIAHRAKNDAAENTLEGVAALSVLHPNLTLELDVICTRDRVPIVFHDIALARLLGSPGTVFDYSYAELCRLRPETRIARLDEVLGRFPGQPFLLDLRLYKHAVLLPESNLTVDDVPVVVASEVLAAVGPVLRAAPRGRLSLMTAPPELAPVLRQMFPDFRVVTGEVFLRDPLAALARGTHPKPRLPAGLDWLLVPERLASAAIVQEIHAQGVHAIVTESHELRDRMTPVEHAILAESMGADGIMLSPIDEDFVRIARGRGWLG